MFKSLFKRSSTLAPAALPAALPPVLPASSVAPPQLWPAQYTPHFTSNPVYFDQSFHLRLARADDDMWAGESSLLARPTAPVLVWVRNQRDELVAHHVFTSAPIDLGAAWWPGIYSLHVEHPDFRDVLCAVKQGPWCPPMPPLDLLAAPNAQVYPVVPGDPSPTYNCPVDSDTSAQLLD